MKKESRLIQNLCIGAIIVCVLIVGYTFLKPSNQTGSQSQTQNATGLAPMVDGKQVLQMTVYAAKYSPNYFVVKAGIPVRWEITSSGQPGCDSGAVIARGLTDPVYLNPDAGKVTVVEFTPQNSGEYTFGCPMMMVRGQIVAN